MYCNGIKLQSHRKNCQVTTTKDDVSYHSLLLIVTSQSTHVWLHCAQLITWPLLQWKELGAPELEYIPYRYGTVILYNTIFDVRKIWQIDLLKTYLAKKLPNF